MSVHGDREPSEEHHLRRMSDEQLVRLVVQGRESNQAHEKHAAVEAWRQLVVREYDRVSVD